MVDRLGSDDMVVLLGTPNPESSRLYGLTLTSGDPAWAGALAGVELGLPVYHITEPEVREQIDPLVYEDEVGLTEMVLETDEIAVTLRQVRSHSG